MAPKKGQCKICGGYYTINDQGRLPKHVHSTKEYSIDEPPVYCRGAWPKQSTTKDYPVSFDHHPREISAGQWESNRRKH